MIYKIFIILDFYTDIWYISIKGISMDLQYTTDTNAYIVNREKEYAGRVIHQGFI